jgi:hypothetical protein
VSLVFSNEFAPVDIGGGGKEIPSGLPCPDCPSRPSGCLRRHAYYFRNFKNLDDIKILLKILRLCCSKCKSSHACLFPMLVPRSSYSASALGKLVTPYFFEDKSAEKIGWEASVEEGQGHRHLVQGLVDRLCEKQDWIAGFIEKQIQRAGESLWKRKEPEAEEQSPNAQKVRSKEKSAALSRVQEMLLKFKESSRHELDSLVEILHQVSMQMKAPFSLLTRAKVMVIKTTHKRGKALF